MTIKEKKEAVRLAEILYLVCEPVHTKEAADAFIKLKEIITKSYYVPREKKPMSEAQIEVRRQAGKASAKVRTPEMYENMRLARLEKMLDNRGLK